MKDGVKFICEKCGEAFYEMPETHGLLFMNFRGRRPKPPEMCDGKVVPIKKKEE
jgi:hypothetical protein